jgi:Tol biopolymer transport system component
LILRFSLYASLAFAGLIAAAFQFGAAIQFSPAEGWLAYTTQASSNSVAVNIEIVSFDENGLVHPKREFGPFAVVDDLAWSPDGDQFVFSDQRNVYLADVPHGLTINLSQAGNAPASARTPVWSPPGDRIAYLFYTEQQTTLRIFDLQSISTQIISAPRVTPIVVWTPTGDTVLLVMQVITNNSGFTTDIMRMSLDTGQLVNLTNSYAINTDPVLSPDGEKIAFMSNRSEIDYQIYTMDADGHNVAQITTTGSGLKEHPQWLSDHKIIFSNYVSYQPDIFVETYDLDTQQLQRLTTAVPLHWYALSRDASHAAVVLRPSINVVKLCLFSLEDWHESCPDAISFPSVDQFVWGR